ncbi:MAG: NUDIX domain-containing protein [Candidatus Yanofskybacteria bacterium]|nr:NUDIX domain-containing protein [Candidatus Yanofskybacteria bacterium]
MRLVYSLEEPPHSFNKSIFLAGPTPRSPEVRSWRPEALEILGRLNYDGVVFIPENRNNDYAEFDKDLYPPWEHRTMGMSDLIIFWVPRDLALLSDGMSKMPALTTNIEYGLSAHWGKSLFGPPKGQKNDYLKFVAEKSEYNIPQFDTLEEMLDRAVKLLDRGALRYGGEREIPLQLWNTHSFQLWYQSQKCAGNRLDGARVCWTFKIGRNKDKVFYWVLHPNIYVTSENRNKLNESFISRFDISAVVLYKRGDNLLDSEIVLVREFRSPVRNSGGFVWELPGGSSFGIDPLQTAVEEVFEEVGLKVDKSRFRAHQSRQMAATLSAHHGVLYSVELTDEELEWCKGQKDIPHGADYPHNPTGERVYTEVLTVREILEKDLVDWSNLGMIAKVMGF